MSDDPTIRVTTFENAGNASRNLVIPLAGNESFARLLADAEDWELGAVETRSFPDGETYLRILSDVEDRSVIFVCTLARPDAGFLRLVFAADGARSLGARSITLIAPYLAYMRQDRRFQTGEAVTSLSFARLLSSSFDRLVTVDPHLHRYLALTDLYSMPAIALHAAPLLADWIATNVDNPLLIGPDTESEQWVAAIAAQVGAPYAVARKIRHGDRNVDIELPDLSRWRDRQPVLVDDIASSGRTLIEAARQLALRGLTLPIVVIVHAIFAGDAFEQLSPLCRRIVSTDSVSHASNAIALAPMIGRALAGPEAVGGGNVRHRCPPEPMDEVDRAGVDSFPASDPPSWMGGVERHGD
ncbi:ribose-phosphate pyrophosphokinase [Novosphingobium pentaromativorans]|nr:ribose-phosphate pyrophosphokinase [Novosphingobium pentaromativorans]